MIDFELLIKYFSGKASPEEAERVEGFVQASPEQYAYFHSLFTSWLEAGGEAYQKPDVQKEWENFLHLQESPPAKPRRLRILAFAASIAVVIGLAGYFLFYNSGQKSQPVIVTAQEKQIIYLPDSSKAVLSGGARIEYVKPFAEQNREVNLSGNASFEVTHHHHWPFIIHLPHDLNIKVTGTQFSVKQTPGDIRVLLDKGSVLFYNLTDTLPLAAGQVGLYDFSTRQFRLLPSVPEKGNFQFSDLPLGAVAEQLGEYFQVHIHFQNPAIAKCRLSAGFNDKNIGQIVQIIALTFNLEYKIEGKNIYLDGDACP